MPGQVSAYGCKFLCLLQVKVSVCTTLVVKCSLNVWVTVLSLSRVLTATSIMAGIWLLSARFHQVWAYFTSFAAFFVAAAGPKRWNSLPVHLRQTDINFGQFKRLLKTFLFECWDRITLGLTPKLVTIKVTYLLTSVSWIVQCVHVLIAGLTTQHYLPYLAVCTYTCLHIYMLIRCMWFPITFVAMHSLRPSWFCVFFCTVGGINSHAVLLYFCKEKRCNYHFCCRNWCEHCKTDTRPLSRSIFETSLFAVVTTV